MEVASATAADITLPVMAAAIWAGPAHHTVAGLMSIRELGTATALTNSERRSRTRGAAVRWGFFRVGSNGSRRSSCEAVRVQDRGFLSAFFLPWGVIGLLFNAGTLFGLTGSVGVGTSAYLTATTLIWIGGMALFGMGALLSHNDFDGERPLPEGTGDIRITRQGSLGRLKGQGRLKSLFGMKCQPWLSGCTKKPQPGWRGWGFGCVPVLRRTPPEPRRPQAVLFGEMIHP
ncbi:hypothetical protein ABIF97_004149 [Bradyrhizobium japonicum]